MNSSKFQMTMHGNQRQANSSMAHKERTYNDFRCEFDVPKFCDLREEMNQAA